jgi:YD repeat-containing protein
MPDCRDWPIDSKENKADATTVSSYTYTVNALGQRTNLATAGTALASSRTTAWGYDTLGQVTSATTSDGSADRAYQYDAIGNRISRSVGVAPTSSTATYTTNALNQYSTITDPQSAISYLYDGWNVIAEYVGSAGLQPALSQTYLWGSDLSGSLQGAGGVGGLPAVHIPNPQSSIYYPSYDGDGNISEYLTFTGTVAAPKCPCSSK